MATERGLLYDVVFQQQQFPNIQCLSLKKTRQFKVVKIVICSEIEG